MLAIKAAQSCLNSFTESNPCSEQRKRYLHEMKIAADKVIHSENGRPKQTVRKVKRKTAWTKDEDTSLLALLESHPDDFELAAVEIGRAVNSCRTRYNTLMLSFSKDGCMLDFSCPDNLNDDRVPQELRICSIIQNESKSSVFSSAAKHGPVFHFLPVNPSYMTPLTKVIYDQFSHASLDDEDRKYLSDLLSQVKKCLLPDTGVTVIWFHSDLASL